MSDASKIVNKLLEAPGDSDSPESYLPHVAKHIEQTRNKHELAKIAAWLRDTTEPFDRWSWDGNALVIYNNNIPTEYYDGQTVRDEILRESTSADDPQPYVDWLGQKTELGSLEQIRFGARIHTSDAEMIETNAQEAGVTPDDAFWDEVERTLAIIESNCLQVLRDAGLRISDEGHDESGRVASVWITTEEEDRKLALLKAVINWAEGDWPSTTSGTMDYAFGADTTQRIYAMTEDAARFIDVTIEFTGTDALVEWSRLNLNEAIEGNPDDPEVFLKSYVPRMLGRLMIEFNRIRPHFPDAPSNWYREGVDGTPLFRYNRASEMRELMRQAVDYNKHRAGIHYDKQVTYRFHVPNPTGHILARHLLEKAEVSASMMEWVEKTNPPIWFYVPVKEFNAYMKMVYPQVKLHESDEVDCAQVAWADYKKNGGQLITIGADGFYGEHAMVLRDGLYFDRYTPQGTASFLDSPWFAFLKQHNLSFDWKATPMTEPEFKKFWSDQINEDDEDIDPKAYLDATTGWIDNFLNAGMTPRQEDTHRGQFWKRYECHGYSGLVNINTRTPRWIMVEFNDSLYGTNRFRRVFEYPDRWVKGMTTDFAAIDRILTSECTRAFGGLPDAENKVEELYRQHQRNREKFLDGRLKEALDDPEMQRYLDQAVREPCFHCGNDLSQPHSVIRTYVQRNGLTHELSGHYDQDGYYTNDDKISANLLAAMPECDLPDDCDTCMRCGKSTIKDRPRRNESVDEPGQYLDAPLYTIEEIRDRLQDYGLSFYLSDEGFMPWGRWMVIRGFTYWAIHGRGQQRAPVKPPFVRDQLDAFCKDLRLTPYHVQLSGSTPQNIRFKLAIPKMMVDPASWQIKQAHLEDPDYREMAQANDTVQRGWLPENAETIPDDPLSAKLREIDDRDDIAKAKEVAKAYLAKRKLAVEGVADPDDPDLNIERHTVNLDPDPILHKLGFTKKDSTKPGGWDIWYKTVGNEQWRVWPTTLENIYGITYLVRSSPKHNWVEKKGRNLTCHVTGLEKLFSGEVDEVDEALDPDDPSVNVERHMASMDIDPIMDRLGFRKLTPSWKCADPDYCWYELHHGKFKWTVTRKSEDEPHMFEVNISRWKPLQGPSGHVANYELIGSAKVHVGEIEKKVKEVLQKPLTIIWRGMGIHPDEVREAKIVNEEKHNWREWTQMLVDEGFLHQRDADRYQDRQNDESNAQLNLLIAEIDELGETATEAQMRATFEKMANVIRMANIRYGSALRAATKGITESSETVYSLPGGFKLVRFTDENSMEVRTPKGKPAGFIAWRSASDRINIKYRTVEIEHLEIYDRFQNRGLGEAVLQQLKALLPQMYPDAKFVVAKTATSQGILDLMAKVFGPPVRTHRTDKLPRRSPDDWIHTMNRGYALFKLHDSIQETTEADEGDPEKYIKQLPTQVKGTVVAFNGQHRVDKHFDAEMYFDACAREDDLESMLHLVNTGLEYTTATELIADYFSDTTLKDFTQQYKANGYSVYIDEDDLKRWVEHNKPEWFAYLWPDEVVVEGVDDPDDPNMVLAAHTQDLKPDPESTQKIHNHPHGALAAQLDALGFQTSWVAGRSVVFGEPYVPNFWSKRYPGSVLYVKLNTETGDVVLGIRSRRMPLPIRLKVRSLAHVGAIVKDVDAAMQQLPPQASKEQEREAVVNVLDHHRQWCVNLGESTPDDPEKFVQHFVDKNLGVTFLIHKSGDQNVYGSDPFRHDWIVYSDDKEMPADWNQDDGEWEPGTRTWQGYLRQNGQRWIAFPRAGKKKLRPIGEFDTQNEAAYAIYRHLHPKMESVALPPEDEPSSVIPLEGKWVIVASKPHPHKPGKTFKIFVTHWITNYITNPKDTTTQFGYPGNENYWQSKEARPLDHANARIIKARFDNQFKADGWTTELRKYEPEKSIVWHQDHYLNENVDIPPEDEPGSMMPALEKGLLLPELKRLNFVQSKKVKDTVWIYGHEVPRYWHKTYPATDGKTHALYVLFYGGQKPEIQARNYNTDADDWYQRGKESPPQAPAETEAGLSACLRDLDAAMTQSAADSLPPDQEYDAIKRVIDHHRKWWDDMIDYLIQHHDQIRGRLGPGEPA